MNDTEIVNAIFSPMFEIWMDESDKAEFIRRCLDEIGETEESISIMIQIGVDAGFSHEHQIDVIRQLLS